MKLELVGVLTNVEAITKVKDWVVSLGVQEGDDALVEDRASQCGSMAHAVVCRGRATMELTLRVCYHTPLAAGVLLFGLRKAGAKAERL